VDWGNLLFGVQGRINRAKFWLAVLVYFVVSVVVGVIGFASGSETLAQTLSSLVSLVTFISGIFVGIKRLHDRDKSGWWLLIFYIVPGVLTGIGAVIAFFALAEESAGAGTIGFLFVAAGLAVLIWAFVELGCLRGTVGPNKYGPDPLAPEQVPAMR
jgi:uncharacterized membrane protein YhaH (DUF805 family)